MFRPLGFMREGRKPRVKMECFWVPGPAEAGPGVGPGMHSFGAWGHREDRGFLVGIGTGAPTSSFLSGLCPSHRPHGTLFLSELSAKDTQCVGGSVCLGWRPDVDSWPPLLSSTSPLAFSYTRTPFGYLEGYLIHPLIDGKTEVRRVELTCLRVWWMPGSLVECSPIFFRVAVELYLFGLNQMQVDQHLLRHVVPAV